MGLMAALELRPAIVKTAAHIRFLLIRVIMVEFLLFYLSYRPVGYSFNRGFRIQAVLTYIYKTLQLNEALDPSRP
jgi:hypothetical protein